jgi:hypothetical protein
MKSAELYLGALIVIVAGLLFTAMHSIPRARGAEPPQRPYSCRQLDDAQRQCGFGQCDARLLERLRRDAYGTAGGCDPAGAADAGRVSLPRCRLRLFLAIVLRGVGHSIVIPRDDL